MRTYLTESDFVTVNIKSIFSKQASSETVSPNERPVTNTTTIVGENSSTAKVDWSKELKARLDANAKLDPGAKEPEFDIENGFWLDFFTALVGEDLAVLLNNIEQLKKDIKILGFKKQTNPLLAFLKIKYVQTELIQTKLINSNTYKAIHNAVANHYMTDSELLKANDYNIIYCRDLYTKQVADIQKYLKIQETILPTNITNYDVTRLEKNKKVFLQTGQKTVRAKMAKLNSLNEIYKLLNIKDPNAKNGNVKETTTEPLENGAKSPFNVKTDLAAFTASKARAFATLQYLGMTFKNPEALNALGTNEFKRVTGEELISASKEVTKKLDNYKITKDSITNIVTEIIKVIKASQ